MIAAAVLTALAVVVLGLPRAAATRRLVGTTRGPAEGHPRGAQVRTMPPSLACAMSAVAVALLVGGPTGLLLASGLALAGSLLLGRLLEPGRVRAERRRLSADLPAALDLLSACLAGGAETGRAASAVARAMGGPCGARLDDVASALAVGSTPSDAWRRLSGDDPEDPLAAAARLLSRAADGGAPVASTMSRLADDARAGSRSVAEQAARRVGVLVVAPLGLCFLPAFILLGIVPVIIGLAGPVLASL